MKNKTNEYFMLTKYKQNIFFFTIIYHLYIRSNDCFFFFNYKFWVSFQFGIASFYFWWSNINF